MFVIEKNNKIKLTIGDTATMLVQIFDLDNKEYEIQEDDEITLTVKKTATSKDIALTKTADKDHYIIINSSDTSELETGLYVYDVQLKTKEGFTYTIIPTSFFQLTSEVSV